jgi:hypothetical protein
VAYKESQHLTGIFRIIRIMPMELIKGLSFTKALQNIKDNSILFLAITIGTPVVIYVFILLTEKRIISEKVTIVMSQGLFIGALFVLWNIIIGKFSKKNKQ